MVREATSGSGSEAASTATRLMSAPVRPAGEMRVQLTRDTLGPVTVGSAISWWRRTWVWPSEPPGAFPIAEKPTTTSVRWPPSP